MSEAAHVIARTVSARWRTDSAQSCRVLAAVVSQGTTRKSRMCCDHEVTLRNYEDDPSQLWYLLETPTYWRDRRIRIQQASTMRYLDAYTSSNDHQAVTRPFQSNLTQEWLILGE